MALSETGLIGGLYTVDFGAVLVGAAGPAACFVAEARGQRSFMAVQVARGWPARARALAALARSQIVNLLVPLGHGPIAKPDGETGYYVICSAPPGPSLLEQQRVWSETELLDSLLKPAAGALADLQRLGVTHRAIQPGNLFQSAPGTPVTLGSAWSAPAACHQPAWLEPPSSAMCLPAGRGDGTTADDVYALGCILLMLAVGSNPVEGLSDAALLRRKLDIGSYAALIGNYRVPSAIDELLRSMLADDPDHRPSPALLATPAAARARRVAGLPMRRAQRAIEIGESSAETVRTLAYALRTNPAAGVAALRNGFVDRWLRRNLGDVGVAGQLDEWLRLRDAQMAAGDARADATLLCNTIATLDPAAPLFWRSVSLWPDGLGPALDYTTHYQPEQAAILAEIAGYGIVADWLRRKTAPTDPTAWRDDVSTLRTATRPGDDSRDLLRLNYQLNPLAPCESPLVRRFWVTRLTELLPVLDAAAAARLPEGQDLIDGHLAAFIAGRCDEFGPSEISRCAAELVSHNVLSQVRLVARLQNKVQEGMLPHICAWAMDAVQPTIARYRSKARRVRLARDLAALVEAGQLSPIADLFDDKTERATDLRDSESAGLRLSAIEQLLASLSATDEAQEIQTRRRGQDMAAGIGALACLAGLAVAVFG